MSTGIFQYRIWQRFQRCQRAILILRLLLKIRFKLTSSRYLHIHFTIILVIKTNIVTKSKLRPAITPVQRKQQIYTILNMSTTKFGRIIRMTTTKKHVLRRWIQNNEIESHVIFTYFKSAKPIICFKHKKKNKRPFVSSC